MVCAVVSRLGDHERPGEGLSGGKRTGTIDVARFGCVILWIGDQRANSLRRAGHQSGMSVASTHPLLLSLIV